MNTIDERTLIRQVEKSLGTYVSGNRILIAFSGGPDSLFLLDVLHRSVMKGSPYSLGIAYVNHNLRSETELAEETGLIKEVSRRYGVPLYLLECERGQIAGAAEQRGNGIEEAARLARYELLEQCRAEEGYDHILTAHHRDDQIETLLMRIFKGSGVHGLTGIPAVQGYLIRPMLKVSKDDIMEYLETRELRHSIDSTNEGLDYERNRIRKQLIPVLKDIYPGYEHALGRFSHKMGMTSSFLSTVWSCTDELYRFEDHEIRIECSLFNSLHPYQRSELLFTVWNLLQSERMGLPYAVISDLVDSGVGRPGESRNLFGYEGVSCYLRKEAIFLKRMVVPTSKNRYLKVVDSDRTSLYPGCVLIRRQVDTIDLGALCIPEALLTGKLVVRSRMEGDVISTGVGTKKILKLYKDWNVPKDDRWKIPVVTIQDRIVGILGKAFGYHDRIAAADSIVSNKETGSLVALTIESAGEPFEFER